MKMGMKRIAGACGRLVIAGAVTSVLALTEPASGAVERVMTDQAIADAVENEMLYDPAVWSETIRVASNRRIVTLSGWTDNILEKERAAKLARSVKGVRSVVNDIEIRRPDRKSAGALQKDVIESLMNDPATDSYQITVAADNAGEVTLTGMVDSWQEKHLAGIVAKGTIGVTAVDNRISVVFADDTKRPANDIKAEVEQRLFWDILVDSGLIDVSVDGRTVRLTGTVGSAAERFRARELAFVNGVETVEADDLKVQDWAKDPNRRNPEYVVKPDSEVARAVMDALMYDPRVNRFDVDVAVSAGTVTLRGDVDNMAAKRSAEQDARNTVGVHRVANRLKVMPAPAIADHDLEQRVRAAFLRDPYVEDYEISAVADRGVVRLYGDVDSYFEKTHAEFVAERINGVTAVINNLDVRKENDPLVYDPYLDLQPPHRYGWYDYRPLPSYRADREIREDIKDELWWSPFVDSDEVTVTVVDGRATLTGVVDSWRERQAASENAWEGGARWVVNNLKVAPAGRG